MKKIFATGLLMLLAAGGAQAQIVYGYSVAQSEGTYTPLSSPTVIFNTPMAADKANFDLSKSLMTPAGVQTQNGTYAGYDLGFEVNIAGQSFSKFAVSGAGYVLLGNEDLNFQNGMGANYLTYGQGHNIVGMANSNGMANGADTEISYKVSGTGDSQCLTVQFSNVGMKTGFWDEPTAFQDYQMKLYKDGRMQLVFNNFNTLPADKEAQLVMGIRLADTFVCASGEAGALTVMRNHRENVSYDNTTASGTTVTFNVPVACVKPTAQPTELNLTPTSTTIEGTFTACADADTYLVVYATGDNTPAAPVDKTTYAVGDKIGENTTVAYFGPDTEFTLTELAGTTKYNFAVYATNAYGLEGPQYNVTNPLTKDVRTAPEGAKSAEIGASTLSSVSLTVVSNENDDNIVVLYTPFRERSSYGDHGAFGTIPADVKAGDELAIPESYNTENLYPGEAPATNGGKVAFVGKATEEPIVISGLDSSTLYYIGVYTIDANGNVCQDDYKNASKQILYTGSFTVIENPWDGNTSTYPVYTQPYGYHTDETNGFRDEVFVDRNTNAVSRGTQAIQLSARIQRGDAVNGKELWMILPPVDVNERHVTVDFSYSITESINRFTSQGYNTWVEGDVMEIQVSEDNGETWKTLTTYNHENNPKQQMPEGSEIDEYHNEAYFTQFGYVNINADLNDYRGKTVLVKYYFKTFATPGFGMQVIVDRVTVKQAEFPEVPEVSVSKITDNSATVNWTSAQTDYQMQYGKVGGDSYTTVNIKDAKTYDLTNLEVNTEYEVMVRGLLADGENYSEWSDVVKFTTTDYPAVDAPENLKSDTETFATLGYVLLSWDKVAEAEKYEVAYRLASSTEWAYQETDEASTMLNNLQAGENYVWKVRAFCTHDRETPYSAQARFMAPNVVGIDAIAVDNADAEYYTLQGVRVDNPVSGHVYIVRKGNKVVKTIAR